LLIWIQSLQFENLIKSIITEKARQARQEEDFIFNNRYPMKVTLYWYLLLVGSVKVCTRESEQEDTVIL
jgi:hypothetical protein